MANNDKTYVLDLKYNDENEIFKLSFQTKWDDISLIVSEKSYLKNLIRKINS